MSEMSAMARRQTLTTYWQEWVESRHQVAQPAWTELVRIIDKSLGGFPPSRGNVSST